MYNLGVIFGFIFYFFILTEGGLSCSKEVGGGNERMELTGVIMFYLFVFGF